MELSHTHVFLRPIGSPLPLGMSGLAIGSFVESGLDLHWINGAEVHQVGLILLAVPFPLQMVACVLAYLARDGTVGAALGVLAASWLAIGLVHLTADPAQTGSALGLMLLASGGALSLSAISASQSKRLTACVFMTASARFMIAGVYLLSGRGAWETVAGVLGLLLTAAAGYCVLAFELEGQRHKTVLPTFRANSGAAAIRDDFTTQVDEVEHEAGVRLTT
jgi:succinate-acetate transporter protein